MSFRWVGRPWTTTWGSTTVMLRYAIGLSRSAPAAPPLLPLPLPPDSTGHSLQHHHLATSHTTTISLSPLPRALSRVLPAGSFFTLRNRALFPALPKPYDPFTPGHLPSSTPTNGMGDEEEEEVWTTENLEPHTSGFYLLLPSLLRIPHTVVNSSAPWSAKSRWS